MKKFSIGFIGSVIALVVISVIVLQLVGVGSFFTIVEAGTVKVQKTFGYVNDEELYPGFHLKLPITDVITFDSKTQEYTMSVNPTNSTTGAADTLSALTFEGLALSLIFPCFTGLFLRRLPRFIRRLGLITKTNYSTTDSRDYA